MTRSGALSWSVEDVSRFCGASGVRLSLDEVREAGRTAFFFDFGEALMYLGGELFDVSDWRSAVPIGALTQPLPPGILESGVGLEYGWRHLAGCACGFCSPSVQRAPVRVQASRTA